MRGLLLFVLASVAVACFACTAEAGNCHNDFAFQRQVDYYAVPARIVVPEYVVRQQVRREFAVEKQRSHNVAAVRVERVVERPAGLLARTAEALRAFRDTRRVEIRREFVAEKH